MSLAKRNDYQKVRIHSFEESKFMENATKFDDEHNIRILGRRHDFIEESPPDGAFDGRIYYQVPKRLQIDPQEKVGGRGKSKQ